MEKLHIGAELAELDLRLRGPGSIYGTEQSGKTLLKIATFSDTFLLQKAKIAAEQIFPNMEEFPEIRGKMKQLQTQDISPD
jgi:RecG-like helicase